MKKDEFKMVTSFEGFTIMQEVVKLPKPKIKNPVEDFPKSKVNFIKNKK